MTTSGSASPAATTSNSSSSRRRSDGGQRAESVRCATGDVAAEDGLGAAGREPANVHIGESGRLDRLPRLAARVAARADPPVERRGELLHPAGEGAWLRGDVLEEQVGAAWLEDTAYLGQGRGRIGHRAQDHGCE